MEEGERLCLRRPELDFMASSGSGVSVRMTGRLCNGKEDPRGLAERLNHAICAELRTGLFFARDQQEIAVAGSCAIAETCEAWNWQRSIVPMRFRG